MSKPKYCGSLNYFFLDKNDVGFQEVKKFILDNYYKEKVGYEVKAIVQYQFASFGKDTKNPVFNSRLIGFIPETSYYRGIEFNDLPDVMVGGVKAIPKDDEDNKGFDVITTERVLTEQLDTLFSNGILWIATILIIVTTIFSLFSWWLDNKK